MGLQKIDDGFGQAEAPAAHTNLQLVQSDHRPAVLDFTDEDWNDAHFLEAIGPVKRAKVLKAVMERRIGIYLAHTIEC